MRVRFVVKEKNDVVGAGQQDAFVFEGGTESRIFESRVRIPRVLVRALKGRC